MLTTADAESPSQPSLPTCLWKENPYGLVSLENMLRFYAHRFVGAIGTLAQMSHAIRGNRVPGDRSFAAVGINLRMLQEHCTILGLHLSATHLERLAKRGNLDSLPDLAGAIQEVQQRIWDELSIRTYLQVDFEKAKYYEPNEPPFGQSTYAQFRSAIDDVLEAGNCLALDRNTGAVFHLMRVMEAGLKVLAIELGIPYAPSWESYLRQLTLAVESDWKSKPVALKAKQPLYKDLIGDLQSVKIAWRNPTMHIVKKYTPDEAGKIYECVKQFMNRLADAGLSETP